MYRLWFKINQPQKGKEQLICAKTKSFLFREIQWILASATAITFFLNFSYIFSVLRIFDCKNWSTMWVANTHSNLSYINYLLTKSNKAQ